MIISFYYKKPLAKNTSGWVECRNVSQSPDSGWQAVSKTFKPTPYKLIQQKGVFFFLHFLTFQPLSSHIIMASDDSLAKEFWGEFKDSDLRGQMFNRLLICKLQTVSNFHLAKNSSSYIRFLTSHDDSGSSNWGDINSETVTESRNDGIAHVTVWISRIWYLWEGSETNHPWKGLWSKESLIKKLNTIRD